MSHKQNENSDTLSFSFCSTLTIVACVRAPQKAGNMPRATAQYLLFFAFCQMLPKTMEESPRWLLLFLFCFAGACRRIARVRVQDVASATSETEEDAWTVALKDRPAAQDS